MAIHLKHGPRLYRPLTPDNVWDWEVQFFRMSWGTKRALDSGAGACSFKFRIKPTNWSVGFSTPRSFSSRHHQLLIHLLPFTFRVGFSRAYAKETRQHMGVI